MSDFPTTSSVGSWSQELIAGHVCHLFEPPARNPHGYVAIYLHGVHLNQLHDKPEFVRELTRHGLPVVAPVVGRSWWTDRLCEDFDPQLTPEKHLLQNVLPFVRQRYALPESGAGSPEPGASREPRIALFGTSMGGQGALRFAYKYPQVFPVVAAIAPAIDYYRRYYQYDAISQMYDEPEAARQDSATLHIHPLNWPRWQFFCCDPADADWWESSDRLRMKLGSLGVPFESDLETTGGGHSFTYYGRMAEKAIGFMMHSLDRERLRAP